VIVVDYLTIDSYDGSLQMIPKGRIKTDQFLGNFTHGCTVLYLYGEPRPYIASCYGRS